MKGILKRLSYSNVVATVALVLAIGGGAYATANRQKSKLPGAGATVSANKRLISSTSFTRVLRIKGMGRFLAQCQGGQLIFRYSNTTPRNQELFRDSGGPDPALLSIGTGSYDSGSSPADQFVYQVRSLRKGYPIATFVISTQEGTTCQISIQGIVRRGH